MSSQSTIKMEKGYYMDKFIQTKGQKLLSQSTIKMEKGYYGQSPHLFRRKLFLSQSTIKMEKGYYGTGINFNFLVNCGLNPQ